MQCKTTAAQCRNRHEILHGTFPKGQDTEGTQVSPAKLQRHLLSHAPGPAVPLAVAHLMHELVLDPLSATDAV